MQSKSAEECLAGLRELESWIRVHGEAVEKRHGYFPRIAKLNMDVEPGATTVFGSTRSIFDEYCVEQGYARGFTGRDNKASAGKVERSNGVMDEAVSASLCESGMCEGEFWYDACHHWVVGANYSGGSTINKLEPGVAPAVTLGLRDVRQVQSMLRPFGAPGWILDKKNKAKKRQQAKKCVMVGYGGAEVRGGYRVVNLEDRDIVCDVDVRVSRELAPVRNWITAMRTDPFYASVHGTWVWRLYDKEPRVRMRRTADMGDDEVMFREDGELDVEVVSARGGTDSGSDVSGVGDEVDSCEGVGLGPTRADDDAGDGSVVCGDGVELESTHGGGDSGSGSGVSGGLTRDGGDGESFFGVGARVTVGTSANSNSRRALRSRVVDGRVGECSVTSSGRRVGNVMSDREAGDLVRRARRNGWGLRFVAKGKGGASGERYLRYKGFTSFAELNGGRKERFVRGDGVVDVVVRGGDLKNDVQKGICEILNEDGVVQIGGLVGAGSARQRDTEFQAALVRAVESDEGFCAAVNEYWAKQRGVVSEVPVWVAWAAKRRVLVEVDGMQEPVSLRAAMKMPEWEQWKAAVELEVSKLVAMGCWEEVPRASVPVGRVVVPSHFVLVIKQKEDALGRLVFDKVKARLVFGGHRSVDQVDYFDTAAYVASQKTVRTVLSLGNRRGHRVVSWDIASAFTFALMDDGHEVFMELPDLLGEGGVRDPGGYKGCGSGKCRERVARLIRHLYGSKDAPRAWMRVMQEFMASIGAESLVSDRMGFRWVYEGEEMNCAVHVDDIVATVGSEKIRKAFEAKLQGYFGKDRVTGGVEPEYVLGMRISRDWDMQTLTLSQGGFVRKVLEEFGVDERDYGVESPLPLGVKLGPAVEGGIVSDKVFAYQRFVGCLQWLVMSTRPDLAFAAGLLGRYASAPGVEHVSAAIQVLKYLAMDPDMGVVYHGSDRVLMAGGYDRRDKLIASVDSDLGGCVETQKSTTGLVIFLNCGPISWKSRKQSTNSTATLEAEMKAAALAGMELVWLRDLVSELGVVQGCVRVMEDNAGCVALAHGQKDTARSNHFKRTQAYVEGLVGRGVMWLDDVPGFHNPADIFTKGPSGSLPVHRFKKLRDMVMGVVPEMYVSAGMKKLMRGVDTGANVLLGQVRDIQRGR